MCEKMFLARVNSTAYRLHSDPFACMCMCRHGPGETGSEESPKFVTHVVSAKLAGWKLWHGSCECVARGFS